MPEPWDHKRLASLIEMLLELLDATELSDADADAVCGILLPKLWRRSGLDVFAFRAVARFFRRQNRNIQIQRHGIDASFAPARLPSVAIAGGDP